MAELLVIADDLTGALDAGVQLARKGDRVLVCLDAAVGLARANEADVIVIDSESRHCSPAEAYETVARLVREGQKAGVPRIYKKTDSGLRGNVGAELAAVLKATGASYLNFVPAYPKQDRITIGGIHCVSGKPLAESIFAKDPVNPMTCSRVDELIHQQSDVAVCTKQLDLTQVGALASAAQSGGLHTMKAQAALAGERANATSLSAAPAGIIVYDCSTDDELFSIANALQKHDPAAPMAGCAGLLEMLQPCSKKPVHKNPAALEPRLAVVSGSANAVTFAQLDAAERAGAYRAHLPIRAILDGRWTHQDAQACIAEQLACAGDAPVMLIDTLGTTLSEHELADPATPRAISEAAGLTAALIAEQSERTMMVVGGDALVSFVRKTQATILEPIDELFPGIVIARYEGADTAGTLISKSGAFGTTGLFFNIHQALHDYQSLSTQ